MSAQSDAQDAAKAAAAGAGRGRVVRRRRDAHGRPAARAGRAAANHPDRRGGRRTRTPGDDAPSGWLWAVVLRAGAQPGPGRVRGPSRRAVGASVRVAAAGGAIGGLAVCAAAAVGGPLLDALDVSEPSFRIAAGIVAAAGRRRRPVPAATVGRARARRLARRARPGRVPRRGAPRPARAGAGRRRRRRRPRDRRRDGDRRRAADRAGRPAALGGPSPPLGGRACWPPRSSPAGRSSSLDGVLDV